MAFPASSVVATNDPATAAVYNNLRLDALYPAVPLFGPAQVTGSAKVLANFVKGQQGRSVRGYSWQDLGTLHILHRNSLSGILPTQTGGASWNTVPTNLANATDDDITAGTGNGLTIATVDDTTYITIDKGSSVTGSLYLRAVFSSNSTNTHVTTVKLKTSTDGVTWTVQDTWTLTGTGVSQTANVDKLYTGITARYVRLTIYVDNAGFPNSAFSITEAAMFIVDTSIVSAVQTPGDGGMVLATPGTGESDTLFAYLVGAGNAPMISLAIK